MTAGARLSASIMIVPTTRKMSEKLLLLELVHLQATYNFIKTASSDQRQHSSSSLSTRVALAFFGCGNDEMTELVFFIESLPCRADVNVRGTRANDPRMQSQLLSLSLFIICSSKVFLRCGYSWMFWYSVAIAGAIKCVRAVLAVHRLRAADNVLNFSRPPQHL